MKILLAAFTTVVFLFWILPNPGLAQTANSNQFINIVNPVRISTYTNDPIASINAEYGVIKERNLPATWLLTYDVIAKDGLVPVIKGMDENQELGIFFEVTPLFAEKAGVTYNKTDSWHRANSLFLSGYPQKDRIKLIDEVFNEFKESFGFYPTSVGSWWNDSFSLEYMQKKYGITANLICADQFETDGYHLWGQFWGSPFYPSKFHAGIPAKNANSRIDVVNIQWASRDPINGYHSSAYSVQDYFALGLSQDYLQGLIKLYTGNSEVNFGQIAIGLEGDLNADSYKGTYTQHMELISKLRDSGYQVVTMRDFSNWYRSEFKNGTPASLIVSDDLLNTGKKAIWYQTSFFRIGFVYNKKESKLEIIDLRTYYNNFQEPFYLSPNFQIDLFINIPSVIDSISNPQSKWEVNNLQLISIEDKEKVYHLNFDNGRVIRLDETSITFDNFNQLELPGIIRNSPKLDFRKEGQSLQINIKPDYPFESEGLVFKDLSIDATYFLWRPKIRLITQIVIGSLITVSFIILFFIKKKPLIKLKLLLIVLLPFLIGGGILFMTNLQIYSVNQSEIDALEHLASLPYGRVAVMSNGCLICKWYTEYPPPAFAGKKNYVGKLSHKPIVYNSTVFIAQSRQQGRQELKKLGVKYIYIVRYEGYLELMPFSPGDLNVEKIYENANTQIWKVKTS